jgi:hypothetical protein
MDGYSLTSFMAFLPCDIGWRGLRVVDWKGVLGSGMLFDVLVF